MVKDSLMGLMGVEPTTVNLPVLGIAVGGVGRGAWGIEAERPVA
jgi:hypothetical protein